MKTQKNIIFILVLIFIALACKKEAPTTPKVLFTSHFNAQSDLNSWTQSAQGVATIDSSCMIIKDVTDCYFIEIPSLPSFQKGKTYDLTINAKFNGHQQGETVACMNDFHIFVTQGPTDLIFTSFSNSSCLEFTQKTFYFKSISDEPITLKILIGTRNGVWIDSIQIKEHS